MASRPAENLNEKSKDGINNPMMLAKDSLTGTKRSHDLPAVSSKRKKPKDMPRRPLSAYNMYFQEERKRTIAKYENGEVQDDFELAEGKDPSEALFQALSRTVANRWKAMSEEDKKPYYDRAKTEMKKYREKMDVYNQNIINSSTLAKKLKAKQDAQLKDSAGLKGEEKADSPNTSPVATGAAQAQGAGLATSAAAVQGAPMNLDALYGTHHHALLRNEATGEMTLPPQGVPAVGGVAPHLTTAAAPGVLQQYLLGRQNHAQVLPQGASQLLNLQPLGVGQPYLFHVPSPTATIIHGSPDLASLLRLDLAQGRTPGGVLYQGYGLPVGLQGLQASSSLYGPSLGSVGLGHLAATQQPEAPSRDELALEELLRRHQAQDPSRRDRFD